MRNNECYLTECLNSVLRQTLQNIEIIIINDASIDESGTIADGYASQDNRIKVIHLHKSVGASSARNIGIDISEGEFIAFMDSDDLYFSDDALYKLYRTAVEQKVDICGGSLLYINRDKTPQEKQLKYQKFNFQNKIYYRDYQYDGGFYRFIYKNNFIKKNKLHFIPGIRLEDCIFFVEAMHAAKYFYCIKEYVYLYRKVNKNKEKSLIFICKKLKARYILIKFAYKNRYLKLYHAQKNAILKDLKLFIKYFVHPLLKRKLK